MSLLILDCDGVLIDSETIASQVVSRKLTAEGWRLSPHECETRFLGQTLTDIARQAEQIVGVLGVNWVAGLADELVEALRVGARLMPGADEFVEALVRHKVRFRVASNSSHAEMRVKFATTGLDRLIDPARIHSAGDVGGRGKPAPDLFLATARAEGERSSDVWVVEDSVAGVKAATAAGMLCYGFRPGQENAALSALGAVPLLALMDLLPKLQPNFCEAL